MQTPNLLTIPEAAERLGVSDATIRRRIKDGSLKANKMPGPFGEQFFINSDDLNVAIEYVNVVPVKHEFGVKELEQLITQTVLKAQEPLLIQNEALRNEMKAMEARQIEREDSHYNLVDERLKELSLEAKKGFWARLFGK